MSASLCVHLSGCRGLAGDVKGCMICQRKVLPLCLEEKGEAKREREKKRQTDRNDVAEKGRGGAEERGGGESGAVGI